MILHDWITRETERKARFILDPDGFYPWAKRQIESYASAFVNEDGQYELPNGFPAPSNPWGWDRFWLELCYQFAKLEAMRSLKTGDEWSHDVATVFIVRGFDPDYKERWAIKNAPQGLARSITDNEYNKLKEAGRLDQVPEELVSGFSERQIGNLAKQFFNTIRG